MIAFKETYNRIDEVINSRMYYYVLDALDCMDKQMIENVLVTTFPSFALQAYKTKDGNETEKKKYFEMVNTFKVSNLNQEELKDLFKEIIKIELID
jgi:ferredoxin-fold anticodon binding domain-containing protein